MGSSNGASNSQAHLRVPGVAIPVSMVNSELALRGAVVEWDLPWLRLGEDVEIELTPGSTRPARLCGVDVAAEPGSAPRLRLSLDFPPQSIESDAGDYEDYEVNVPTRRRSTLLACLVGIALGIGALQLPQVRSLVDRAATAWKHRSPVPAVIEDAPEHSDGWQSVP